MYEEGTIGIDLGTRYAQMAIDEPGGGTLIIPNRWGGNRIPAMVAIACDDFLVGEDARRVALFNPQDVFWDMKRRLGTDWVARHGRRSYTPEELLLPLLSLMREDAEAHLRRFVSSCVLAVPASFGFPERGALARAASQAGFERIRIVNEPTAAALSVGVAGRFMVIDFGAGTIDVSVVEGEKGVFQVLESHGRRDIGGFDIDKCLAENLCRQIGIPLFRAEDPRGSLMLSEAENIKIALSVAEKVTWQVPSGLLLGQRTLEITRPFFESLINNIVEKAVRMVEGIWQRAAPQKLLLVGGSSRIPLLRRHLEKIRVPERARICPEDAVVIGSAMYANQGSERLLIDVLSRSLGVLGANGEVVTLLSRGVPLPAEARRTFSAHGSGSLEVIVVQGESRVRSLNRVLQTIFVDGVSDGESVEVVFRVDGGGLLHVEMNRERGRADHKVITLTTDESGVAPCDLPSEVRVREERIARLSLSFANDFQKRLEILTSDVRSLRHEEPAVQWEALAALDRMIREIEGVVGE